MDNRIIINGSSSRSIEVQKTESGSAQIGRGSGVPKYVGARAEVVRVDGGVLVRLTDFKGTTEEIVYEAIESIEFDGGIMTITLPDGRTFTSDDLTGPTGPKGEKGDPADAESITNSELEEILI